VLPFGKELVYILVYSEMTVRFYLLSRSRSHSAVVLVVRHMKRPGELQTLRLGTGIVVPVKAWDSRYGRLKKSHPEAGFVNRRLEEIRHAVVDLFDVATRVLNTDPIAYIKKELPSRGVLMRPERTSVQDSGLDVLMEQFVEARSVRPNTRKTYRTALGHLRRFCSERRLTITRLTSRKLRNAFEDYLVEAGLNDNSRAKMIKIVVTMLRWAEREGYALPAGWQDVWRTQPFVDSTQIALTREELERIRQLDLSSRPALERARALLLAQCYTGLRYSDLHQLCSASIEDGFIRIRQTKTDETLAIPVTPALEKLLTQWGGRLPRPYTNQYYNRLLKELGRLAGMDEEVTVLERRGGRRIERRVPRWQLLTTHVGRRTFITLSLSAGLPADLVMRVSGHRDMRAFQKYVRMADSYVAEAMRQVWR